MSAEKLKHRGTETEEAGPEAEEEPDVTQEAEPAPEGEATGEGDSGARGPATARVADRVEELPDERPALLATTKSRVAEVLAATDRAAESILDAARAEGAGYLRETHERVERLSKDRIERLVAVTEDLLGHADRVRSDVERLHAALDATTAALAAELGVDAPQAPAVTDGDAPSFDASSATPADDFAFGGEAPAPEADREDADEEPATGESKPPLRQRFRRSRQAAPRNEPVEILVLQMLASGADREAIEERLREEFGVDDPGEMLASIGIAEGA